MKYCIYYFKLYFENYFIKKVNIDILKFDSLNEIILLNIKFFVYFCFNFE